MWEEWKRGIRVIKEKRIGAKSPSCHLAFCFFLSGGWCLGRSGTFDRCNCRYLGLWEERQTTPRPSKYLKEHGKNRKMQ